MNNQQPLPKDTLLGFKGTSRTASKDKDGNVVGERIQYALTQAQAQALVDELTAKLGNEAGVKLDIHIRTKTNSQTGQPFESSFGFVKAIGQAPAAVKRYVPKAAAPLPTGATAAQAIIKQNTVR